MSTGANRQILFYGRHFFDFYHNQDQKVKMKIDWTIGLIRDVERIPEKYFKHIEGTDLYEIRINYGNNIFRIFCFPDKGKLIIVLNGFQKKTQKTLKNEIERAIKLQQQYYEQKE